MTTAMKINELTDSELKERILILRGKEREVVLKFLVHLGEFDQRKLYLPMGYSSLFDYCVRALGYSEGSTQRRVESARCLREFPELGAKFLNGEVTMCTIATAAKALRTNKALINEIRISRDTHSQIQDPLFAVDQEEAPSLTPAVETRYEIKFSVSKEEYDKIQKLKCRMSNKLGSNLSIEGLFTELVSKFTSRDERKKIRVASTSSNATKHSRYIPVAVKREVTSRDNYQCSFVSKDGVRCTQKHYLHLDHIRPFALGGSSTGENLRLLCANHNQMLGRETFGERCSGVTRSKLKCN